MAFTPIRQFQLTTREGNIEVWILRATCYGLCSAHSQCIKGGTRLGHTPIGSSRSTSMRGAISRPFRFCDYPKLKRYSNKATSSTNWKLCGRDESVYYATASTPGSTDRFRKKKMKGGLPSEEWINAIKTSMNSMSNWGTGGKSVDKSSITEILHEIRMKSLKPCRITKDLAPRRTSHLRYSTHYKVRTTP